MSWVIPDLVIESILRDGFEDLKANPTRIDELFAQLNFAYAARKNGTQEIDRIRNLLTGVDNQEIAIVHSFHSAEAKPPSISIQLGHMSEDKQLARLQDFEESFSEPLSTIELASLVKIASLLPDAYDSLTGKVSVPDSVDVSLIFPSYIFVDGASVEHIVRPGVSNVDGNKFFFLPVQTSVDIGSPGSIKSQLTEKIVEVRSITDDVSILLGVHSKEALLTKYLFMITQFILASRKDDLIARCFIVSTMSGSDFRKDMEYQGDQVFNRFLTIYGKVEQSWRSDQVSLIDSVTDTLTPLP